MGQNLGTQAFEMTNKKALLKTAFMLTESGCGFVNYTEAPYLNSNFSYCMHHMIQLCDVFKRQKSDYLWLCHQMVCNGQQNYGLWDITFTPR